MPAFPAVWRALRDAGVAQPEGCSAGRGALVSFDLRWRRAGRKPQVQHGWVMLSHRVLLSPRDEGLMATGRRRGLSPAHGARRDGARRDEARRAPRRGGRLVGAARGCLFVLACWVVDFAMAAPGYRYNYGYYYWPSDDDSDDSEATLPTTPNPSASPTTFAPTTSASPTVTPTITSAPTFTPLTTFSAEDSNAFCVLSDATSCWGNNHYFVEVHGSNGPFESVPIPLGWNTMLAFGDVDGDGDLDLLVGGNDELAYYENVRSSTSALYGDPQIDPFDWISSWTGFSSYSGLYPALADLDGDADFDLVVGTNDGTFAYFENTGSAMSPTYEDVAASWTNSANPFHQIEVYSLEAFPVFGDLDGDGDLDLVLAEVQLGVIEYVENVGNASFPRFPTFSGENPFDGIYFESGTVPTLGDLDGDFDLDLLVSGLNDVAYSYYENAGSASSPKFEQRGGSANPVDGIQSWYVVQYVAALVGIDGDADLDVVVPQDGIYLYLNVGSTARWSCEIITGSSSPFFGIYADTGDVETIYDDDGATEPGEVFFRCTELGECDHRHKSIIEYRGGRIRQRAGAGYQLSPGNLFGQRERRVRAVSRGKLPARLWRGSVHLGRPWIRRAGVRRCVSDSLPTRHVLVRG